MEKRTDIRWYVAKLYCDKCDGGEMLPTGICLMSYPPQYPHKCNKCDNEVTPYGGKKYPLVDYYEAHNES